MASGGGGEVFFGWVGKVVTRMLRAQQAGYRYGELMQLAR